MATSSMRRGGEIVLFVGGAGAREQSNVDMHRGEHGRSKLSRHRSRARVSQIVLRKAYGDTTVR
ncbi:hypothetical protein Tdes44962_MAKER06494 [Teratosphaeria destructans]|uniref:Uncharacterized protein n=1 Tax=Teratosphaeria destructans TaxID=418781 RepID=A0A9W7W705_9PEZI|nr:hypothetical protein Tdes44962_MAKER06494 [Teratosphaeria destructans]